MSGEVTVSSERLLERGQSVDRELEPERGAEPERSRMHRRDSAVVMNFVFDRNCPVDPEFRKLLYRQEIDCNKYKT